jgi:hypothetical protein
VISFLSAIFLIALFKCENQRPVKCIIKILFKMHD